MIAVMAATGTTGNALLTRLIELDVPCRALTRTPEPLRKELPSHVEVVGADAADPGTLRAAFAGADQVFLAMANQPRQVALELNAVEAAVASGVRHVVKLSAPAAEPDSPVAISRGHFTVEAYLKASGLRHTVLRPYAFMQKLLLLAPGVAGHGVVVGAMGDAPCNYIDARDIADVAATALTRTEVAGRTYDLTGGQAVSYAQLAAVLGRLTGREVRYIDLRPEDFRAHLTGTAGMPDWLAAHIVEIQQLAVARPESPNGVVESLLGRPARTLESFLDEHADSFR